MRRSTFGLAAVLAAALLIVGVGRVVSASSADAILTGCLTQGGTLTKVNVGAAPLMQCSRAERQVTWGHENVPEVYVNPEVRWIDASRESFSLIVECNEGDVALSGGWTSWIDGAEVFMDAPWRLVGEPPTAWMASARNTDANEGHFLGYVTCMVVD